MRWSYGVWGALGVLFLVLELAGEWRLGKWVTLSETVWDLESHGWPIRAVVLGATIGLVVHFVFKTDLFRAESISIVAAIAAHLIDKHWP